MIKDTIIFLNKENHISMYMDEFLCSYYFMKLIVTQENNLNAHIKRNYKIKLLRRHAKTEN